MRKCVNYLNHYPTAEWNFLFAQVLDAFSSSVEAFKRMKNQYGLNESSVDDTMSEIQEVRIDVILANTFELTSAIIN